MIKDSGQRIVFESGAERDCAEGRGRCDLLPLDVVSKFMLDDKVLLAISCFQETKDKTYLNIALDWFSKIRIWDRPTMILEVSKHFEEGAKKYGERNWEKGIPVNRYIDSAVRHYLKWLRGDTDEPHDRAFVWNILCCIWTVKHSEKRNPDDKNETCACDKR